MTEKMSAAEFKASQQRTAAGKGKTPAGGTGASGKQETAVETPVQFHNPHARFYKSTTRTDDGLGMARLVGFTNAQWDALTPLLAQLGFRPY